MTALSRPVEEPPLAAYPTLVRPAMLSRFEKISFYGSLGLLLFGPLAFGAVEAWAVFILQATAAALLVVWFLLQLHNGVLHISPNPLFPPALAFAALVIFQVASNQTAYRYRTIYTGLLYAAYGILAFLVSQCFRRTSQVKQSVWVFSIYGAIVAIGSVLQSITGTPRILWLRTPAAGGWIYGPYVNHNHYAGLMEMLTPIPLVFALTRFGHPKQRVLAGLVAALMASTIFLCGSRGGMVAFSVELALLGAAAFRNRSRRELAIVIFSFVLVSAGLLAWLGGGEVIDRIATFQGQAHTELSGGTRLAIAHDGLKMFLRKPILGWGLGVFPDVYPRFRSFYTNFFVNAAHDDYVQMLVETGLAGLGAALWFLVLVYQKAFKKLANWPSDTNGAVALAALLGCTGILVHSLFDFNLQIPANAALFYVLCTIAASPARFGATRRSARLPAIIPQAPSASE
jgi:O-antigen ligase